MAISEDFLDQILSNGPSPGTLFLVLSKMKEEGHVTRVIQECLRALQVYPYDIHVAEPLGRLVY